MPNLRYLGLGTNQIVAGPAAHVTSTSIQEIVLATNQLDHVPDFRGVCVCVCVCVCACA